MCAMYFSGAAMIRFRKVSSSAALAPISFAERPKEPGNDDSPCNGQISDRAVPFVTDVRWPGVSPAGIALNALVLWTLASRASKVLATIASRTE